MSEYPVLDILLNARKTLEAELQSIRDNLAVKTKTLEALNSTISLVRGRSAEELKELNTTRIKHQPQLAQKRLSYDDVGLKSAIEVYFLEVNRKGTPRQIAEYLIQQKLVPAYTAVVRYKIRKIIKTIPSIVKKSSAQNTYYESEV